MIVALPMVVYNESARDGTWCKAPYQNHPHGCPNFVKGCTKRIHFTQLMSYKWYAVIETFDLKAHAERMKEKHPLWTDRQCRNPLYWQGTVRANLRKKAILCPGDILLDIPEANGVEVFETMKQVNIILEKTPDMVTKVMLIGRPV